MYGIYVRRLRTPWVHDLEAVSVGCLILASQVSSKGRGRRS
jgi:hypothetical protein